MSFKNQGPYEAYAVRLKELDEAEAARPDHYVVVTVGPIRVFSDAMLEGQRLVGYAAARQYGASFGVKVEYANGPDAVVREAVEGFEICDGCGSTMTDDDVRYKRENDPYFLSCCPERKMRVATRADWDQMRAERASDHENINLKARFIDKTINQLAAAEAEIERLKSELTAAVTRARWNVEDDGNLVRLCRGEHDKSEACSAHEERFIPEHIVKAELDKLDAQLQEQHRTRKAWAERANEAEKLMVWAVDTLVEINPSNYDHDDVCRMNDASVEVILALQAHVEPKPDEKGKST